MEFSVKSGSPEKQRTPCIVVGVYEPRRLSPVAEILDQASNGQLSALLRRGDMEGKAGQTLLLHNVDGTMAERVLLVGCGRERDLADKQYRDLITRTVSALNDTGSVEAVNFLTELNVKGRDTYWKVRLAVEATLESLYSFDQLKTKKEPARKPLKRMVFNLPTRRELNEGELAILHGNSIGNAMNLTRDLGNLPANLCTPVYLAEQAQKLADSHASLSCEVLTETDLAELGMNSYLAVAKGSIEPPRLSVLSYQGADPASKPIVVIGKGLTFDSGGISLKPAEGMDEMKYDMCGAASVLGLMQALAELKLPLNVIGLAAAAENMPGSHATRPGDIVTTMSGQTVEILNTDAEGRLVLCDVLTYVERFEPEVVIDVATLTGACIIALGHQASGLLSNHNPLAHDLLNAGESCGDRAWRLPLWDEYQEQLDSNFADMANIGGRPAGSITAACFLSRYAKKYQWAHLDIAGTAWRSGKSKGATGRPVPLLTQYLLDRAADKQAH